MNRVEPIEEISLVDRISLRVRRSIIGGLLPPGEAFSIVDLSNELGVSHIPVREALRRLETEGLVILRPGRGAIARGLDADDIRGIYRLRRTIEPALARASLPLVSQADIDQLEVFVGSCERNDYVDLDTEMSAHKEFHHLLLLPAASEWDRRILNALWNADERYIRLLFQPNVNSAEDVAVKHTPIVAAARSGSPEALETAVLEHLIINERSLLDAIEGSAFD